MEAGSLFVVCFVVLHVSDSYSITCITLELKICTLVLIEISPDLPEHVNTTLVLLILLFMSASVPPVV